MATAKERGHKDWGFGGVVKRDFKADKSEGEYNDSRDYSKRWYSNTKRHAPKRKKNTKRWCKGIEGREHLWRLFKKYEFGNWWEYRCDNCRKELWGTPKYGFVKRISYHSNDEFDIVPVSELKS